MQHAPFVKDLVLIGGGHVHLTVLKRFGMRPLPGVRLTLVSRRSESPYSGMLPGLIAGHYSAPEMHVDLRVLAGFAGARFVQAEVTGLDLAGGRVLCAERPPLAFDLLSINTGITPSLSDLEDGSARLTPVKPIDEFSTRWELLKLRVLAAPRPLRIGVVGGGAGGVELVLAVRQRLVQELALSGPAGDAPEFHLLTATAEVLPAHNRRTRARFVAILAAQGIHLHTQQRIVRVDAAAVYSANGQRTPLDEVLWATSAAAPPWLAACGLAVTDDGYVRVAPTLCSVSHPMVFAAGDCASVEGAPRPKSGVYAVRQGRPLAENLRRACVGERLRAHHSQHDALAIMATGPRHAVASRGQWAVSGEWVWRWKDFIDRRFMRQFQQLPAMTHRTGQRLAPALAAEVTNLGPATLRCGGCGAKVGAQVLADALRELPAQNRADIVLGLGARDDAAVTTLPPNCAAVHTIDGFRSFVTDPFVFGQIVAAHALSDVFAMGAQAQSALAYVTLPLAAPALVQRDLATLMAGALRVLNAEGAQLVGGHTSEGAELSLALAINGYIEPHRLRIKDSLALGDVLILTKALGTGVIMAGDMRGVAKPAWVDAALAQMVQTNGPAARALTNLDVHAMTDITGFGLAGHLREMLRSGGLGARLTLAKLPVLAGARELLAAGIRSTLHAQNEPLDARITVSDHAAHAADFALLFDPQTSGGLLVAVPPGSLQACLVALRAAGAGAAVIGQIFSRPNLA